MVSLDEGLAAQNESEVVDFKRSFDTASPREWAEIVKDIVAMANSGGGYIFIGLDDDSKPITTLGNCPCSIDPADITNKIYKYTDQQFHNFQIKVTEKTGLPIVALVIGPASMPIVFTEVGTYVYEGAKQKTAFSKGTVYFRHGAKSEPSTTDDLRHFFDRLLETTRKSWLDGIAKVVEAPAGSRIAVIPAEIPKSSSPQALPVRIVDDPNATPYYALKVDDTHPHRAKEVVILINERLQGKKIITSHAIICIRRVYQVHKNLRFCYTMNYASPRYSNEFVEWVVSEYNKNPSFFEDTKGKFESIKTEDNKQNKQSLVEKL